MNRFCLEDGCNGKHRGKGFCIVHYRKYYRKNNQEKIKLDMKNYREKNKDRIAYLKQIWYLNNKEHVLQKHRDNPEIYLKSKKKWFKKIGKFFNMDSHIFRYALDAWSRVIRKRDKKCQNCGSKKNLNAHHLLYKKLYPLLCLNLNNGITLCEDCHKETHGLCLIKTR